MLTPEATETPIPLTGEVRPKIGPTAQTGTRAASDDAGRAGLAQRLRKGTRPGLFIALYIPLYERLTVGSIAAAHKAFAMFVTPLALAMLSA